MRDAVPLAFALGALLWAQLALEAGFIGATYVLLASSAAALGLWFYFDRRP